jgi:hypothetical protein
LILCLSGPGRALLHPARPLACRLGMPAIFHMYKGFLFRQIGMVEGYVLLSIHKRALTIPGNFCTKILTAFPLPQIIAGIAVLKNRIFQQSRSAKAVIYFS